MPGLIGDSIKSSLPEASANLGLAGEKAQEEGSGDQHAQSGHLNYNAVMPDLTNDILPEASAASQSFDFQLPSGSSDASGNSTIHVSSAALKSMKATNALDLAKNQHWLSERGARLARDVKRNGRDALDDAGKLVLALLLMFLGIPPKDVVIDTAQAGGACANADGFLVKPMFFIEVKASIAKKRIGRILGPGARPQFTVSCLRFGKTWWQELVLVCRERDPKDWTNVAEYAACGFWIGIVSRSKCVKALLAHGKTQGQIDSEKFTVAVSPWTADDVSVRHGSWLSPCIEWIPVSKLLNDPQGLVWLKNRLGLD